MKALAARVNIIPVVGKADSLSADELQEFQAIIAREIQEMGISVFDLQKYAAEEGAPVVPAFHFCFHELC